MLPPAHRLRSSSGIRAAVRRGRRAGSDLVVVHLLATSEDTRPARAALVVGRAVGPSVTRHRVQRRLRHLLAPRIQNLPRGTDLVVRARPEAANASSADLGAALDVALNRVARTGARPS